jgi:hypothetical protein
MIDEEWLCVKCFIILSQIRTACDTISQNNHHLAMTSHPHSKLIALDTNQYAGNFERELCAYLTGRVGECGVGENFISHFTNESKFPDWWEANINLEPDEHGCMRPATIVSTPGWFNNGYGLHLLETEENYKLAASHALKQWTTHNIDADVSSFKPARHPCYNNVGIFVLNFPPLEVFEEMQARASNFFLERASLHLKSSDVYVSEVRYLDFRYEQFPVPTPVSS